MALCRPIVLLYAVLKESNTKQSEFVFFYNIISLHKNPAFNAAFLLYNSLSKKTPLRYFNFKLIPFETGIN